MRKILAFSIIGLGFSSMASQIVLMRQLMIVFYGNELSLGITLSLWLIWVALGSWLAAKYIVSHLKRKLTALIVTQLSLAVILPLTIFLVRLIPLVFNFVPGEIIGLLPMTISTAVILFPVCSLGGFSFVLGCELYKSVREEAIPIGYVYILEAVGASLGGLLTNFILIRVMPPLNIMITLSILNLILAKGILFSFGKLRGEIIIKERISKGVVISVLLLGLGVITLGVTHRIEWLRKVSLNLQWRGYKLLVSRDSLYGNIAITQKESLFTVFNNGLYNFTVPDLMSSERAVHFPLLEHPNPQEVLIIGGGVSGQLREILKHPVKKVDYVELDPLVIKLAKKYLPSQEDLSSFRVNVITEMDGRLFVKRTTHKYDVVIINVPDPHTAQLNRFYTVEFYQELKRILKNKGIISFSMYSNPNYISSEQASLYLTIKNTLKMVFSDVFITPGETNYFLASQEGILTKDWRVLMKRLQERNIQAKYMREYYLFSDLSPERIDFFNDNLSQAYQRASVNSDFKPIAYYYDLILWNTYFKYNLKRLFSIITPGRIYSFLILLSLFLLFPLWFTPVRKKAYPLAVFTCVATTGFSEITFQVLTLIAFQVIYGYVYYKLGIILTSYMIGLILGGWWVTRTMEVEGQRDYARLFFNTQVAIFVYPLILPLLFLIFSHLKGKTGFWIGSNIVFPLLPIIPGFIGGYQFPLANKLYIQFTSTSLSQSAGYSYGLDLLGSCLGALFTTLFLIPVIGIYTTALISAGINFIGLFLLFWARMKFKII